MGNNVVSVSWADGEIAKRDAHIDTLKSEIEEMRQDRTMNNPPQDEGDSGKPSNIIDDLAMLVSRLCFQLPGNPVAAKAMDYLKRAGLQGSLLRSEPTPATADEVLVPRIVFDETVSILNKVAEVLVNENRYSFADWVNDAAVTLRRLLAAPSGDAVK